MILPDSSRTTTRTSTSLTRTLNVGAVSCVVTSAAFESLGLLGSEEGTAGGAVLWAAPFVVPDEGAEGAGAGGAGFCAAAMPAARTHIQKPKMNRTERDSNRRFGTPRIIPLPPPAVRLGQCHQNAGDTDR